MSLNDSQRNKPTSPIPLVRYTAQAQWAEGDVLATLEIAPSPPRWGGEGWGEAGPVHLKFVGLRF